MRTRTRSRAKRSPFDSLPRELFETILDDLSMDRWSPSVKSSLASCSRVCKSWTDSSNSRLYSHLDISSDRLANLVAHGSAFRRYTAEIIRCDDIRSGWEDIGILLKYVEPGLKELAFKRGCVKLPARLLGSASLRTLKILTLCCSVDETSFLGMVSFQLDKLAIDISDDKLGISLAIVNTFSLRGGPGLPSLDIQRVVGGESVLHTLGPILPTLSSICLSDLMLHEISLAYAGEPIPRLVPFLPLATSLSTLTIHSSSVSTKTAVPLCVRTILNAIKSFLKILRFILWRNLVSSELLDVLKEEMADGKSLGLLTRLDFDGHDYAPDMMKSKPIKGWVEFEGLLDERHISWGTKHCPMI